VKQYDLWTNHNGPFYHDFRNPEVGNFFDRRYPTKSGTNFTEAQEPLNMALTTKETCSQCGSLVVASWNSSVWISHGINHCISLRLCSERGKSIILRIYGHQWHPI